MGNTKPIECTEDDKAAANEAFEYARFALIRHGYDLTDDTDACAEFALAIVKHMKALDA
jgi:hypothetical protein